MRRKPKRRTNLTVPFTASSGNPHDERLSTVHPTKILRRNTTEEIAEMAFFGCPPAIRERN